MARGWFRRKKGKLVYCCNNAEGLERSKVVGPAALTDEEGWLEVGKQGLDTLRTTSTAPQSGFCQPTFLQLKTYYFENKEFRKNSTKCLRDLIVNDILTPEFGKDVAVAIKPKRIKSFLKGKLWDYVGLTSFFTRA